MKKINNCIRCGKRIYGMRYSPYNVTFEHYECKADGKKMCFVCAEAFIKSANKCKGGHWEIRGYPEKQEASQEPYIYKRALLKAGEVNNNGDCYSEEALKEMSDKSEALILEDGTLYHTMEFIDPDPEMERIFNENLWDLV